MNLLFRFSYRSKKLGLNLFPVKQEVETILFREYNYYLEHDQHYCYDV